VKDHNRKLKKDSNSKAKKKNAVKPVSIPNKCPFKEELLAEAEKRREELKQEKVQKKLENKAAKDVGKKRKLDNNGTNVEQLQAKALRQIETFAPVPCVIESLDTVSDKNDKTTRVFAGEVRKTIESADILIEVLDARDPLGSRNLSIEQSIIGKGKRLVLLLNKIDLVPKSNVESWLKYLRAEMPTIAFKASTQEQTNKLGRYISSNLDNSGTSKCIGADLVMKLLGNYCRNKDIKTSIRVGVIGYPNVGKSSVINSLKRKKSCQTGATPGLTRQLQEVELDKHIRLIDSPGVVLATKGQFDPVEVALKNALRVEGLADPIAPVNAILRRCSVKVLMLHFNIPEFNDCDEFLALLARKIGRIKKGGRPDMNAAAKHVGVLTRYTPTVFLGIKRME
jgi:nuclear GTP-binding protein